MPQSFNNSWVSSTLASRPKHRHKRRFLEGFRRPAKICADRPRSCRPAWRGLPLKYFFSQTAGLIIPIHLRLRMIPDFETGTGSNQVHSSFLAVNCLYFSFSSSHLYNNYLLSYNILNSIFKSQYTKNDFGKQYARRIVRRMKYGDL